MLVSGGRALWGILEHMNMMEEGSLVIINCHDPKEKIWGVLMRLDRRGPVIRGLSLTTFEDWLKQERQREQRFITPMTVFIPMHRVERIDLDEGSSLTPSFGDRYRAGCEGEAAAALLVEENDAEDDDDDEEKESDS